MPREEGARGSGLWARPGMGQYVPMDKQTEFVLRTVEERELEDAGDTGAAHVLPDGDGSRR